MAKEWPVQVRRPSHGPISGSRSVASWQCETALAFVERRVLHDVAARNQARWSTTGELNQTITCMLGWLG